MTALSRNRWCHWFCGLVLLSASLSWDAKLPAQEGGRPDPEAAAKAAEDVAKPLADAATEGDKPGVNDVVEGAGVEGAAEEEEKTIAKQIDDFAGVIVAPIVEVIFFDPVAFFAGGAEEAKKKGYPALPLPVIWLAFGALFFTLYMKFFNLRALRHAVDLVRGVYSSPDSEGEVTHFQALCAALSATVGLGNIGGVAVAVVLGGPGAVLWMVIFAFFGMTSKFVECTLGQKYRHIDAEGRVSGGAMHYLRRGLAEIGLGPLGVVLAVIFSILCIGASFGGGNMFQANQSFEAMATAFEWAGPEKTQMSMYYGGVLAVLVALVIIGGIKRIATTASRIVPAMCGIYIAVSIYIILTNFGAVPDAIALIFETAFSPGDSMTGGLVGVIIVGVQRAAFSNEAGVGSAPIAHSAAKADEPVQEGIVSLLEPFIDTVLVCSMTGIVVVVTGAYEGAEGTAGAAVTAKAWGTAVSWFPYVLTVATVLFAFSTLISWSYYGERCWASLFGQGTSIIYKMIFVCFVFVGSVSELENVILFSDCMLFGMAFPNLIGCLMLVPKVRAEATDYWRRVRAGEVQRHK